MFFTTRDVTKYGLLCLLAIFFTIHHAHADNRKTRGRDSLSAPSLTFSYKQLIVPAALMVHGTIETVFASNVRLLNYAIGHKVIKHQPEKFQIDDISQYVPAASVYALNLVGVKGRHGFKDRTIILGMSAIFMAATVNLLKYTTRVERPDKSTRNSFPSGHTAVAFMGAEFLWQEYKDASIWYGIGGYTVAIGTGIFRMYNNRHWFGDVAFGAGVGILSTKLAYWIYPAVERKFSRRRDGSKHVTLCPYYNGRQGGLSLSIQL
jgi:membrane-associated phospholipid phosphatase